MRLTLFLYYIELYEKEGKNSCEKTSLDIDWLKFFILSGMVLYIIYSLTIKNNEICFKAPNCFIYELYILVGKCLQNINVCKLKRIKRWALKYIKSDKV